eukprot:TRINITY_DN5469_c1_g2_i3.p2 TRINITY_DN5469_c1_g2~~TRINITY_DN5469_c1_g2_i3.p2  ORF type:complete len:341 (+),score=50.41 TRINITY_DN5469_c1_g2_i3:849-1871(+)
MTAPPAARKAAAPVKRVAKAAVVAAAVGGEFLIVPPSVARPKAGQNKGGRPKKQFKPLTQAQMGKALGSVLQDCYAEQSWINISYTSDKFNRFVSAQGTSLANASPEAKLVAYVARMEADGLRASSMLTEMGCITAQYRLTGIYVRSPLLDGLTKALNRRKKHEPAKRATPMTPGVLHPLLRDLRNRRMHREAGVMALAWLLCARVADVRRLQGADLQINDDDTLVVRWRKRKDWSNVGLETRVHLGSLQLYVSKVLAITETDADIGGSLSTKDIAAAMPAGMSAHSLRRGSAQWMLRKGAEPHAVLTMSLHASLRSLLVYAPSALSSQQLEMSSLLHTA